MPHSTSDKRAQAASLIQQALDLGVRKELRAALTHALEIAQEGGRKELTDLHYRRLAPGGRLADPNRPGLIMKASKTGLRRWTYRTEVDGKQRELTMGHYPAMSVADAREKWAAMRSQRVSGETPDTRSSTTLEELVDRYSTWGSENLRTWKANDRLLRQHLLPGRESITLADLDVDHLNAPITAIQAKTPQQARKLRSAISGVLTRAKRADLLPKGFAITPAMLAEVESAKVRTWHPGSKDLRTFLSATREMGDVGRALRLIALTGCRLSEVVEMRWDELEGNRWTLPSERMKAKRPHVVFLSPAAMDLLEENESEFVFPGAGGGSRSTHHVSHLWLAKRTELGLDSQFTAHTLRKALATWVAESGGTRDIRDRLTAHATTSGADAHYNMAALNKPAAEWWAKWADHLAAIESANVVLLGEGRA